MSIIVDGFFSADADAVAEGAVPLPAWRALTRDLNRTVQRLFGETGIPFGDHLSPPLIARMLLGRALSNFQGAVLLSERGMTVEGRTLVRSCLETAFCLTAVLSKGEEFTDRLVADAEKHRRMLVRNLLSSDITGDLGIDMESRLRTFLDTIPDDVEPKWLPASQMAEASPLHAMFVFYRELSGDAHPTVTSMERYFVEGADRGRFRWGPEVDTDTAVATYFYACTFLIAAAVGFNSDVAKSEAFEVAIPTDSLTVEYDKASQILSVKLWSYSDAVRFRREVKESTYKGQNAYGATTTVVKSRGAMYGFAIPGSSYSRKDIIFSKTLEPAAAKALSEKIVLRFKGNLIASEGVWKIDGTPVQNRPVVSEATVSNPSDIFVQYYQVTGKIDTADWVDSRTGEVLGTISSPKF